MKATLVPIAVVFMLTLTILLPTFSIAQGTWTRKADFLGSKESSVSFSIGTKGYMGIGKEYGNFQRDFWEWNQETNVWTKKADFPGKSRGFIRISFSIGTKGYIGIGDGNFDDDITQELWEYDALTDSWAQKTSLPVVSGRIEAGGFSIGTKGYILAGKPCDILPELWEWDQETDVWTQKASFKSTGQDGSVSFSIGDKGYVSNGFSWCDDTPYQDFWEWDQKTNEWIQKDDFPGGLASKVGFSFGNKGYILGWDGTYTNVLWEWDQETNEWAQKASFPGIARYGANSFSIGNKGYVGAGGNSISGYADDFWEFDPSEITGLKELTKGNNFFYPNPASDFINLNTCHTDNTDLTLNIYNVTGKSIRSELLRQNQQQINLADLKNGIYMIEVKSSNWSKNQKLIIQR